MGVPDAPIFAGITWCGPCQAEAGYLQRVADDYSGRCQFVTISVADDATLNDRLRAYGLTMPVIRETSALISDYDVGGVPKNFILDRYHRIGYIHEGLTPEQDLRRDIDECLRRPYIPRRSARLPHGDS